MTSNPIYIGNLDYSLTEDEVREFLEQNGKVASFTLRTDKDGKSRGFGIAIFECENEAEDMCKKSLSIKGRRMVIRKEKKNNKVYINNIPNQMSDDEIKRKFSTYGKIIAMNRIRGKNGYTKGYVFATFENEIVAKNLIATPVEINGERVKINYANSTKDNNQKSMKQFKRHGSPDRPEYIAQKKLLEIREKEIKRKVHVTGLSDKTKDKTLETHFEKFGVIVEALVMKEKNGNSKGYGFVTYAKQSSAEKALKAKKETLDGNEVKISRASLSKSDRELEQMIETARKKHRMEEMKRRLNDRNGIPLHPFQTELDLHPRKRKLPQLIADPYRRLEGPLDLDRFDRALPPLPATLLFRDNANVPMDSYRRTSDVFPPYDHAGRSYIDERICPPPERAYLGNRVYVHPVYREERIEYDDGFREEKRDMGRFRNDRIFDDRMMANDNMMVNERMMANERMVNERIMNERMMMNDRNIPAEMRQDRPEIYRDDRPQLRPIRDNAAAASCSAQVRDISEPRFRANFDKRREPGLVNSPAFDIPRYAHETTHPDGDLDIAPLDPALLPSRPKRSRLSSFETSYGGSTSPRKQNDPRVEYDPYNGC